MYNGNMALNGTFSSGPPDAELFLIQVAANFTFQVMCPCPGHFEDFEIFSELEGSVVSKEKRRWRAG